MQNLASGTTVTITNPPAGIYTWTPDGGWQPNGDGTFQPNMPVIFDCPGPGTNTFYGVLPSAGQAVPVASGTNSLMSLAAGLLSTDLGFTNASPNDQVWIWNSTAQSYSTYTNLAGTHWTPSEPYLSLFQPFLLITTNSTTWTQTISLP